VYIDVLLTVFNSHSFLLIRKPDNEDFLHVGNGGSHDSDKIRTLSLHAEEEVVVHEYEEPLEETPVSYFGVEFRPKHIGSDILSHQFR
jgi:hypothetical protein